MNNSYPSFSILDRNQTLPLQCLIEASAGTGKTFTIAHLVVRFLIESQIPIEKMLLVTFTRAASRELKRRVRLAIYEQLQFLKKEDRLEAPDYIQAIEERSLAIHALERALVCFDQIAVHTIHGCCERLLREAALGKLDVRVEGKVKATEIRSLILRYFKEGMTPERYSSAQIRLLVKKEGLDALVVKLEKILEQSVRIQAPPYYLEANAAFQKEMNAIRSEFVGIDVLEEHESIVADYCKYKNEALVQKNLTLLTKMMKVGVVLEEWIFCGMEIFEQLDPAKKRAKVKNAEGLPPLLNAIKNRLLPHIQRARCLTHLLARVAFDCALMVEKYLEEEEKYRYDDLLHLTLKASQEADWVSSIQEAYPVVVIDEFQDTDRVQWEIFRNIFFHPTFHEKRYLYLVGDPKQSIYSFRQADIYTYIEAANAFGAQRRVALDRNFRSDPALVCALNDLFSSAEGLFSLPKRRSALEYRCVEFNGEISTIDPSAMEVYIVRADKKRSRKWPSSDVEQSYFLPFITKRIIEAKKRGEAQWRDWAILVRDRHQADSVSLFLKNYGVPCCNQRKDNIADSKALMAMMEILEAVSCPRDKNARHRLLIGFCLHWNLDEIVNMDLESILDEIYKLKRVLEDEGIAAFFIQFMESHWNGVRLSERILARRDGAILLRDLEQIVQILSEEEKRTRDYISVLKSFSVLRINGDPRMDIQAEAPMDAVRILTIHTSKGLEFSRVFPLGLINRTFIQEGLLCIDNLLTPSTSETFDAEAYAEEIDAEKMRQLYVALTRAKNKLYLPVLVQSDLKEGVPLGTASPIELFLEKISLSCVSLEDFFLRCRFTVIAHEDGALLPFVEDQRETLLVPKEVKVPKIERYICSFSSLYRSEIKNWNFSLVKSRELSFEPKSNSLAHLGIKIPIEDQEKTLQNLPKGIQTGLLFHRLMEELCFEKANDKNYLSNFIQSQLQATLLEAWTEVLVKEIPKLMTIPFLPKQGSLSDLRAKHLLRESSFFYASGKDFVRGMADLIFFYEDQYYLLDWKTNDLGSVYSQENLEQAMHQHHYFLQAKLYVEALKRYLALLDQRPFEQIFGGVYYFFIRGLDKGIYYFIDRPSYG